MINNPLIYAANNTHVTHTLSQINIALLCDANMKRRGGLMLNQSRYSLKFYLGEHPPTNKVDWLVLPYGGNADIPYMYVGKIWGYWEATDDHGATTHEFYGDFT